MLITGGAGFIGCSLSRRLLADGDEVTVLDSLHPQVHTRPGRPAELPTGARLVTGDVEHAGNWETLLKLARPEVVVHLAAETGTGQSLTHASRHAGVNVLGTARMLDALMAADAAPAHLVLTSSRAVYGEGRWMGTDGPFYAAPRSHAQLATGQWNPQGPGGEDPAPLPSSAATTEPRPANIYAATKLAQEHMLAAWTAATGSALSVLRLQNVYGPGQSLTNPYTGVVSLFGRLGVDGEAIDVYEDGEIVRDFVYIEDVTAALRAAVRNPPHGPRTLDIGCGTPTTIHEVAATIARITAAPAPRVSGRFRDGDVRAASCDISAARADLGYAPEWPVERGLGALVEWIRQQPPVAA
ncbi:MAG: NAD-dependent epimerase/dehydratase family protein [Candidatus Dormibacteria bacterium]